VHACAKCRIVSSFNDTTIENMDDSLTSLKSALHERLTIIGDEGSRRDVPKHMARLQAVSAKIEALQASLPASTDPRLKHYLERRSYDKALEWIEHAEH
jgi:hypothetical protein